MRLLLLFAFAALAYAGTIVPEDVALSPMSAQIDTYIKSLLSKNVAEIDLSDDAVEADSDLVEPRFIISWQIRRFIRKLQKQMPCGWEQYGIPPLAPLKKREANVHLKKGIVETFDEIYRFRVDGLDKFKIQRFKINIITRKITFDFLFKDLRASAEHYKTDTLIDALRQLGLSVQYEGDGTLDFGLVNLRIAGVLRYKIPVLWGSIKITSLKTQVTLEDCKSNIKGFLGDGTLNRFVNEKVEEIVVSSINDNQQEISDKIERTLVPKVNKKLKGNDFWTIYDYIFKSSDGESENDPIISKCIPPADPWA